MTNLISNEPPVEYGCPCAGHRQFEVADEPAPTNAPHVKWHVCACCGQRKLLPPQLTIDHNNTPVPE